MDKKLGLFLLIFFLLFAAITYISLTNQKLPFLTRAAEKNVDINKCLMLTSKLEAVANGQDLVILSVFVRNDKGVALDNKAVIISTNHGTLNRTQTVSDTIGKAEFQLLATTPGLAEISVLIEGQTLPKPLSIRFNTP